MASPTATVLLVEDNPDNQAVYRVILEHVGYRVLDAWDGEEGVRLAREAEDAGCDAYLSKPALPRAVVAAVERMIGTAAPGARR